MPTVIICLVVFMLLCMSALAFLVEMLAGSMKELAGTCMRLNDRIYELEKIALNNMRASIVDANGDDISA